jgi:phage baseplate assembly protein gpV
VTGNVRAGTTIANAGTIGGTATPNAQSPPIAAPTVAACSPFSDPSGISGKFTYNAATGDLTVSGGKTVTLADGAYCFHELTLSGGSSLSVSGPVSIVVTDKLDASGGGFANTTHIPANLQISSSYSGTGGVTLSGGSGLVHERVRPENGHHPVGRLVGLRCAARQDARALGRHGRALRRAARRRMGSLLQPVARIAQSENRSLISISRFGQAFGRLPRPSSVPA